MLKPNFIVPMIEIVHLSHTYKLSFFREWFFNSSKTLDSFILLNWFGLLQLCVKRDNSKKVKY